MNSQQAKNLNIHDFLQSNRYFADEKRKNFYSVRGERTASLHVTPDGRGWFDHGTGTGGSIIDLVMYINQCGVRAALQILEQHTTTRKYPAANPAPSSFHQQKKSSATIEAILPLQDRELLTYANKRGIETPIAKTFCKEVLYTVKGKAYRSIGFNNDSNGWELRNEHSKMNIKGKDISTIVLSDATTVNVFEGFFDMLSYYQLKKNKDNSLVLNSTALTERAIPVLQKYDKVRLFLDNDSAGTKATNFLKKGLSNTENCAVHYKNHQDLNEYLQKRYRIVTGNTVSAVW